MRFSALHKRLPLAIVVLLSVLPAACGGGGGFEGTYLPASGGPITLDFTGGKVKVNMMGEIKVLDYKVETDKVTILNPAEGNLVLVRNSDGSLSSTLGTFSKSKK
jgi:hypothetical protein